MRFVAPVFSVLSVGSTCVQLFGAIAGAAADPNADLASTNLEELGVTALKTGLAVQSGILCVSIILGIRFAFVSYKWINKPLPFTVRPAANWHGLLWTVNLASIAIMVRSAGNWTDTLNH